MMQAYKFNTHISDKGTISNNKVEIKKSAPEGYMTLEEFRVESKRSLTKILNDNGVY